MSRYIPNIIRKQVIKRSNNRCEYCKSYEQDAAFPFHIEHIISLKHGGLSTLDNLAYSCAVCNINKGSDIATFLEDIKTPIRFFNPRTDIWENHFDVKPSGLIIPQTNIAAATIKILDLNSYDSILERHYLLANNLF